MKNSDMIPKELKELHQWVGSKKKTKIPMMFTCGELEYASSSNPETWTTFDGITEGICRGIFDNYGFVFNNNGIVGIDIDDGFGDDGFLSEIAIDIMRKCRSYTEYSHSRRGMHIYLKGDLPFDGRNNRRGVEIYKNGRFFIVTGEKLIYSEIIENQEAIDYILEKYFPETVAVSSDKKKEIPNIYQPVTQVTIGEKIKIKTEYPEMVSGSRNTSMSSLAGQLFKRGYSKEAVLLELRKVNAESCNPPLAERELNSIVKSIARYS